MDSHIPGEVRQRHADASSKSITSKIVETAGHGAKKLESKLLLCWDELPHWRRDNVFIVTGYRQTKPSYSHTLFSLLHLHNESVNIWSHLIGAILAIATGTYLYHVIHPRYESASTSDIVVFACFLGGAFLCLGMSATFHALLSHSEEVARWGNKLDYSGIVALIVGSYVPALYYGFFCRPRLMTPYLALIVILGLGCGIVSWVDKFRKPQLRVFRASMFIGLGLSGVIPVVHGTLIDGYQALEDRMSISLVIFHGALYIFGAVLYASRWPECSFPGHFDIWGSSHQIFHVCVVLAATTHLYGMAKAFDYHHTIMGSQCLID